MTLYDELVAAGCTLDHHESDLYVLATPEAWNIIRKYPYGFTRFRSEGRNWIDLPFMYSPWWEHK